MILHEFNAMSLDEKASCIWQQGTFLSSRTEGDYSLMLYHMGRFFCEIGYYPGANKIVLVQAFTSHTLPESYLNTLELP